jgi:hypothetical protein
VESTGKSEFHRRQFDALVSDLHDRPPVADPDIVRLPQINLVLLRRGAQLQKLHHLAVLGPGDVWLVVVAHGWRPGSKLGAQLLMTDLFLGDAGVATELPCLAFLNRLRRDMTDLVLGDAAIAAGLPVLHSGAALAPDAIPTARTNPRRATRRRRLIMISCRLVRLDAAAGKRITTAGKRYHDRDACHQR